MIRLLLVALLATAAHAQDAPPVAPPAAQPADAALPAGAPTERWKGTIALPNGKALEFSVVLIPPAQPGAEPTGTMSIPMQGVIDAPLTSVVMTAGTLAFTLAPANLPPASRPSFTALRAAADADNAKGSMTQSGFDVPITLSRLKEGETAGPLRPQNPKPPFPYDQRDVAYTNPADNTTLAGTLTYPKSGAPFPAVILITGSGPQDRDETLFAHKPFLVIADHLTRTGFAVLRVDDRGVGGSTSPKKGAETTDDFATDVLAGVDFLKKQPDIDPKRIALVGHSEGGLIAPMVAAQSSDVAAIVLLAGPGVSGLEILREQIPAGARASGASEDDAIKARDRSIALFDAVIRNADDETLQRLARDIVVLQAGPAAENPGAQAQVDSSAKALKAQFSSPWFRRFLVLDPADNLRKVKVPVLALNGALDKQVIPEQNIPRIESALKDAGNPDATTRVLPGLNHLFQTATTGSGAEYATIEETFAPAALDAMTQWLAARLLKPAK